MTPDQQRELRSLVRWKVFTQCLLGIAFVSVIVGGFATYIDRQPFHVATFWQEDLLTLRSDRGNWLLVGLRSDKAYAILPAGRYQWDSGDVNFDRAALEALDWRTEYGEKSPAPKPGVPVNGLYFRPSCARPRSN